MLPQRYQFAKSADSVWPMDSTQLAARDALYAKLINRLYVTRLHACPVCDSQEFETLAEIDRYGLPSPVAICENCGLVQGQPYLEPASLDQFYAVDFPALHRSAPNPTDKKFRDRRQDAKKIVQWLERHGVSPKGRLLDVGCSSGGVLQGLIDAGFEGRGVELNAAYSSFARNKGLKVNTGTLADADPAFKPDIVTYCQVLEHIPDITGELTRLKKYAPQHSIIYIEVPGLKQLWPTYHLDFLRYLQLAHIWHFSLETLTALMAQHGFKRIAGDQYVRALFIADPDQPRAASVPSDYLAAIASLKRSEFLRKLYPLDIIRAVSRLSKRMGLRRAT